MIYNGHLPWAKYTTGRYIGEKFELKNHALHLFISNSLKNFTKTVQGTRRIIMPF